MKIKQYFNVIFMLLLPITLIIIKKELSYPVRQNIIQYHNDTTYSPSLGYLIEGMINACEESLTTGDLFKTVGTKSCSLVNRIVIMILSLGVVNDTQKYDFIYLKHASNFSTHNPFSSKECNIVQLARNIQSLFRC